MTNQSPAEALRQQITDIVYKIPTLRREAARNEIMELVTAYAATVEREARQAELKHWQWKTDGHIELSGKDVDDRLAALQGPIQDDAPDPSEPSES